MFKEIPSTLKIINETTNKESSHFLAFLNSRNIYAFPCGRRRSTLLGVSDPAQDNNTTSGYRIPFDPEARLNTEANNRKHSSLNGFTQTYLANWPNNATQLAVVLAGYVFNIDIESSYTSVNAFGNRVAEVLATDLEGVVNEALKNRIENLYINILLEDASLFSDIANELEYSTKVLSSLVTTRDGSALDLLLNPSLEEADVNNFYFAGLAFSSSPLTAVARAVYKENNPSGAPVISDDALAEAIGTFNTREEYEYSVNTTKKHLVSLHLLTKVGGVWQIHEPARLPKVEHGLTPDSIIIGDTQATSLNTLDLEATKALVTDTLDVINDTNDAKANINDLSVDNFAAGKWETDDNGQPQYKNLLTIEGDTGNLTTEGSIDAYKITADILDVGQTIEAEEVKAGKLTQNGKTVPHISLSDLGGGYYQLQISLDPSPKKEEV